MNIDTIRHFFAYCAVINYAMLLLWFALFWFAHGWLTGITEKWFGIPADKFDTVNYKGMVFFKMGIFLLNIAPYLALRIIG